MNIYNNMVADIHKNIMCIIISCISAYRIIKRDSVGILQAKLSPIMALAPTGITNP
jgi:hypothetical protein